MKRSPHLGKNCQTAILHLHMVSSQGRVFQRITVCSPLCLCSLVEIQKTRTIESSSLWISVCLACTAFGNRKAEKLPSAAVWSKVLWATWSAAYITLLSDMTKQSSLYLTMSDMGSPALFSFFQFSAVYMSQKPGSTEIMQKPPGNSPLAGGTGHPPSPTKSSFTVSHCLHPPEKIFLYDTNICCRQYLVQSKSWTFTEGLTNSSYWLKSISTTQQCFSISNIF